jgi:hypothetical protein
MAGKQDRGTGLRQRVESAADVALRESKSVAPLDVLCGIGWLPSPVVGQWRQGRIDNLERVLSVRPDRLASALDYLQGWARRRGLVPSQTAYLAATRDRRPLQFTADGDEAAEAVYRTHWISAELSEAKRSQLTEQQSRPPDLVVIEPLSDFRCTSCAGTGPYLLMEGPGPLCLTCADMDHLIFLPAGHAALSRRAKKESGLAAVVVRYSRSRKRYERQGILVEQAALERAEEQCLADGQARERRKERDAVRRAGQDLEFQARLGEEISRLFPGCPSRRAQAIARHAATRGSGRVGRSAAARVLDEGAISRAVVASVRHQDTDYDTLLMSGVARDAARERVGPLIDQVLDHWRAGRR